MKKSIFLSALCLMNVALSAQDYELRTLTFEDADAHFTPYTLDYANKTISTWSDLVDDAQYNGPSPTQQAVFTHVSLKPS